jgi:hypothetical protein
MNTTTTTLTVLRPTTECRCAGCKALLEFYPLHHASGRCDYADFRCGNTSCPNYAITIRLPYERIDCAIVHVDKRARQAVFAAVLATAATAFENDAAA